ncbi:MAG: hypothetical protein AAF215_20830, partial [Cyanobacteria bacterium P01_A01_bin.123]
GGVFFALDPNLYNFYYGGHLFLNVFRGFRVFQTAPAYSPLPDPKLDFACRETPDPELDAV